MRRQSEGAGDALQQLDVASEARCGGCWELSPRASVPTHRMRAHLIGAAYAGSLSPLLTSLSSLPSLPLALHRAATTAAQPHRHPPIASAPSGTVTDAALLVYYAFARSLARAFALSQSHYYNNNNNKNNNNRRRTLASRRAALVLNTSHAAPFMR